MKKRILVLLAAFTAQALWAIPAHTETFTDDCNNVEGYNTCFRNCSSSVGIGFAADFLWWKPCIDNLDYAIKFSQPVSREQTTITRSSENNGSADTFLSDFKSIHLDWEPGVRVMAWATHDCSRWGVGASWTYVNICDTASIRITEEQFFNGMNISNPFFVTTENATAAKASFDAAYHDWDVLALHSCFYKNCHRISPFAGIAGMVFNQEIKEKFRFFNPADPQNESEELIALAENENDDIIPTKWKADYWGVGLRVGFNYEFAFLHCFRLFARADGSLLAGKVTHNKLTTLFPIRGNFAAVASNDSRNRCHFVPGYHIAAGLIYDVCLCDVDLLCRLGYEFVHWHNLPSSRIFTGGQQPTAVSIPTNTRTLSFHGLIAGVGVSF